MFNADTAAMETTDIMYCGTLMIVPAEYLCDEVSITVTVDGEKHSEFSDWSVDEIQRETEGDISTFTVAYVSEEAKQHQWKPNEQVEIEISLNNGIEVPICKLVYVTHGTKEEWYDYLKPWEGQKNNWYDYFKVWENSVVFELVEFTK